MIEQLPLGSQSKSLQSMPVTGDPSVEVTDSQVTLTGHVEGTTVKGTRVACNFVLSKKLKAGAVGS